MSGLADSVVLTEVVRGGEVECVHRGRLALVAPDGAVRASVGDLDAIFFGRSSLKPLQALAMVRHGLDLEGPELSLACGSHTGQDYHQRGVIEILAGCGLGVEALQNTPLWPANPDAAFAWRQAGNGPASLTGDCSGKHAGMLRTCVRQGWDIATYLDLAHPLQQAIATVMDEVAGGVTAVTVDGCGAPLFGLPLTGFARAFGTMASASSGPEAAIAAAMRGYPLLMSGDGEFDARLMTAAPGVLSKGGAEGCLAIGLPTGEGLVLKSDDGSGRGVQVLAAELLRRLGHDTEAVRELARVPVLGHGEPVGEVRVADALWESIGLPAQW